MTHRNAVGMMAIVLMFAGVRGASGAVAWINEVDYDMVGTDTAEWLEIVGTAGLSLNGWTLQLLNGSGGGSAQYASYDLTDASFTFADETGNGWGFFVLGLGPATVDFTPTGWVSDELQNGAPDRIRLLDDTATEVHLFNYEEASNTIVGTADSTTALDSNTVVRVLAKTGSGNALGSFNWTEEAGAGTPGAINTGQTLTDPPVMNGGDPDYAYALPEPGVPNKLTIGFDGFTGAGFAPSPLATQLDSDNWTVKGLDDGDLNFGGTGTTGDYARGSSAGGVTTGGVYAFDHGGGDVGLGVQPGGSDFTPGSFDLLLPNDTGATITDLKIMYDIWVRNDQARSNSLNFAYSVDGIAFTDVPAADFTSDEAADAQPVWAMVSRTIDLTGLAILDGGFIVLRWLGNDVGGSLSRDEFALDNIMVTNLTGVEPGGEIPTPSSAAAIAALAGAGLLRRRRRGA